MSDLFDMSGSRALITGASRGLGRHFASTLAKAGADVAITARNPDALAATAAEVEALGRKAFPVAMEVTDPASVANAVEAAEAALGPLDVLVNNAGMAITKPALETTPEEWQQVIDTNLSGAFLVAREVAKRMAAGGGGRIVNIASIGGMIALGRVASYCASKAGLIHLTHALARELARHDVRVNAIAPGYVETDLNRDFFASEPGKALIDSAIPQRRLGQPAELDGALLLLASNASPFMTGSVVVVDGGHSLG
jgi:NAD(P)-dependent dehydrogenase (short-subunit alcohol dehydrogenase family)